MNCKVKYTEKVKATKHFVSVEKLNSEKATSQKTFKVYICKRVTVDRDNVILI